MTTISDIFGIHERALRVRNDRLEVIATNIANGDTPRFKARDIDFRKVLGSVVQESLKTTDQQHFPTPPDALPANGLSYRVPFNAPGDGNTVEMSVEQAQYGRAAADYRASLMFIENRASGIKRALRGE